MFSELTADPPTAKSGQADLAGHLGKLPEADAKTRALVDSMRADEARHRETAIRLGAADMPRAVRTAMRFAARVMTTVAYRV